MLMMRRRAGESVLIGPDIEIHIAHIGRTRVKIAIDAPRNVKVIAKEVAVVGQQNHAAAVACAAPALAGKVALALKKSQQASAIRADMAGEG
jgi:carbon storage regulator